MTSFRTQSRWRELYVPTEFRMGRGDVGSKERVLHAIMALCLALDATSVETTESSDVDATRGSNRSTPREAGHLPPLSGSALPDLCIGLWRLRRRMIDPDTGRPLEDMRKPFRHLESVWDTLAEAGVDIRDHTNELVPEYGSIGLNVLAYQPMPGISRERVIETVKPSIYVGERLVQMGQVIIGTPEKASHGIAEGEHA